MVKYIILDLGGVILNIDFSRAVNAFKAIGLDNFDELYQKVKQTPLFDELETGCISEDDFVKAIKKHMHTEVEKAHILEAWNALLLDFPPQRIDFIKALRKNYPVFLLSNTNAIHARHFEKDFANRFPKENWNALFDAIYYSHELGMRKPNAEIFEHVLTEQRLDPTETLFIDDTERHIEGAKKVGLQTYHLQTGEEVHEVLPRLLAQLNQ